MDIVSVNRLIQDPKIEAHRADSQGKIIGLKKVVNKVEMHVFITSYLAQCYFVSIQIN